MEKIKITKLKLNPKNPRFIRDEKFEKLKRSIHDFPRMMELRPIIVDDSMMILGGNMRYRACLDLGWEEVPFILAKDLTEEQKKEFIIKDNVPYGEWDWEIISSNFDQAEIEDWGLEIPGIQMNDGEGEETFMIPDGDRPGFQQMSFIVSDEQAEAIKQAISIIKAEEDFKSMQFDNLNSNGNAVYFIVSQWAELKK